MFKILSKELGLSLKKTHTFIFLTLSLITYVWSLSSIKANASMPLRFSTSQSFSQGVGWTISGYGLWIGYSGSLNLETVSTVTTATSYKYAEKGKSSTLTLEINNQPSVVTIKGNLYVDIAGARVGTREITLSSTMNSQIGHMEYDWGSMEVFSATYGIFEIVIILTPKIEWWTQVTSSLATSGPVTVSPSSLTWYTSTKTSTIASFTDDQPASITLSNPTLSWSNVKFMATFSGILRIAGVPFTVVERTVTFVDLPSIMNTAPSIDLISFEPNYFKLFSELNAKYSQLLTSYQELSATVNAMKGSISDIQSQISVLGTSSQILPWIAIFIGIAAIVVSMITLAKRKV
jgi:hypothetical protein